MRSRNLQSKSCCRLVALAMTKNDRCRPQNRAADNECEIGHKQWQQHKSKAAKHRCPIFHPFSVSKNDEAEGAEDDAGDRIHYERGGHRPCCSLTQASKLNIDRIHHGMHDAACWI
jgi:hypothetical protein